MKQPVEIRDEIRLKDFDPSFCNGMDKEDACKKTARLFKRIGEFQELLYANAKHALLILLQGMDASGKDGTIKRVLECVNPAGVETAAFKQPSAEERAHDFLWRVHKAVPQFGRIGVFNRSHYEDVLIVRVLRLEPASVWRKRYDQINAFEKILARNGVVVLKFFLHISKEEQAERLRARLEDPAKNWKFSHEDLKIRQHWESFQKAYEEAINRCSTAHAPWHIVPADRKWYRDYVVARTVVRAFEKLCLRWPKPSEDLSRIKIR